jgi:uncharacterized protein (UPF0276 family)
MLFGINWISPSTLPMIQKLIKLGKVDFCEIMVDNFAHLPTTTILAAFPDVPIALHIVQSRFLEKPLDDLKLLADYLRPWIKDLNPLYVSDHLVEFSKHERFSPLISELDYENTYFEIKERIQYWQAWLDTSLLFENHASLTHHGCTQASFFKKMMNETGADLLFDFSNAYIAEYNQVVSRQSWSDLIVKTKHFHVAGFKIDPASGLALDTHNGPIDAHVLDDIHRCLRHDRHNQQKTLTIEFDAQVNLELWEQELCRLKNHI